MTTLAMMNNIGSSAVGSIPYFAWAIFDYAATKEDELKVEKGDFLVVDNVNQKRWCHCQIMGLGKKGWVPPSYVQRILCDLKDTDDARPEPEPPINGVYGSIGREDLPPPQPYVNTNGSHAESPSPVSSPHAATQPRLSTHHNSISSGPPPVKHHTSFSKTMPGTSISSSSSSNNSSHVVFHQRDGTNGATPATTTPSQPQRSPPGPPPLPSVSVALPVPSSSSASSSPSPSHASSGSTSPPPSPFPTSNTNTNTSSTQSVSNPMIAQANAMKLAMAKRQQQQEQQAGAGAGAGPGGGASTTSSPNGATAAAGIGTDRQRPPVPGPPPSGSPVHGPRHSTAPAPAPTSTGKPLPPPSTPHPSILAAQQAAAANAHAQSQSQPHPHSSHPPSHHPPPSPTHNHTSISSSTTSSSPAAKSPYTSPSQSPRLGNLNNIPAMSPSQMSRPTLKAGPPPMPSSSPSPAPSMSSRPSHSHHGSDDLSETGGLPSGSLASRDTELDALWHSGRDSLKSLKTHPSPLSILEALEDQLKVAKITLDEYHQLIQVAPVQERNPARNRLKDHKATLFELKNEVLWKKLELTKL